MMSRAILFFAFLLLPTLSWAGSRGVKIAFLDATAGDRSQASLRLAELLEKDIRALYGAKDVNPAFLWNEPTLDLKILDLKKSALTFDRLLNTKDAKTIPELFEKNGNPDGLIVFYHDVTSGSARLKLYNWDGKECLLIRLPLEGEKSAMSNSLLKHHRYGALIALGASVRWSP